MKEFSYFQEELCKRPTNLPRTFIAQSLILTIIYIIWEITKRFFCFQERRNTLWLSWAKLVHPHHHHYHYHFCFTSVFMLVWVGWGFSDGFLQVRRFCSNPGLAANSTFLNDQWFFGSMFCMVYLPFSFRKPQ